MNGRVYDPQIGRFISADPTMADPLNSQAFNRYSYVYNNPLSAIDPSGYVNWPLLDLGLLHLGTGTASVLGGGSLAVSGIIVVAVGAGTSEFGIGVVLIVGGGAVTLVGISNVTTGASDVAQSSEEIYSSLFGSGSVPQDAVTQIYGQTTGSILTDTSLIHDLLTKATETAAQKLLEAALKQAAQQAVKDNNKNQTNPQGGDVPGGSSTSVGDGYNPFSGVPVINGNSTPGTGDQTLCEMAGCSVTVGPVQSPTVTVGPLTQTPPPPPPPNKCMQGGKPTT